MANHTKPFDVLLIAGIDALGLARFPHLLHQAGCKVTLMSPPGLAINRSRYVHRHILTTADASTRAHDITNLLSQQASAYALVIIGDEPSLAALSHYQGQTCLNGWFPVDHHHPQQVEILLSKWAFQQAAINAGLYTPLAKICHDWPAVIAATDDLGYPVMLKSFTGLSGSGVRKVHDAKELVDAYSDLTADSPEVVVQRFYGGKLGSTDVLFNHGTPVCWQSSYSLQCWPTPLAASSARAIIDHPDVANIVACAGAATGFHGFAGIDWIHDTASDHLYVLELNPRITPSHHLDHYANISFSHSLQQLLSDQATITAPQPKNNAGRVINMFPQSLYWAISARDWRVFLLCWLDAPWHDPNLMLAYLRRVLSHFLPKNLRSWLKPFIKPLLPK